MEYSLESIAAVLIMMVTSSIRLFKPGMLVGEKITYPADSEYVCRQLGVM